MKKRLVKFISFVLFVATLSGVAGCKSNSGEIQSNNDVSTETTTSTQAATFSL